MNRCSLLYRTVLLACGLGLGTWPVLAQVQATIQPSAAALEQLPQDGQHIPPISAQAQHGVLRVAAPPDVLLNGKAAWLSPGLHIHDTH